MNSGGSGLRNTGDSAVATEIELKLCVPSALLRQLLALPVLQPASRALTRRMAATYFDTPELDLRRHHIALRVRREGRRWIQAVKWGGAATSGVHERLEVETLLRDGNPDLTALPRHRITKILESRKVAESLTPVLCTEITRTLRQIEPASGVLIEVAIDRGFIRSGRRREQVCEVELELKQGPVTALFDVAHQLLLALPLTLEHRSKADRGYALFLGQAAPPAKAAPVKLAPAMTAGQAFRTIVAAALAQVHANERGVMDSRDPEYLHQMRVGTRRLRSAFSLFRDLLGDDADSHVDALRAIARGLGPARDWDVFVTETLPAVRPALAAHGAAERFESRCLRCRQSARRDLKILIKSISYKDGVLALGRWLAAREGAGEDAPWDQPARACATQILELRYARVLKRGRHVQRLMPPELHRLRIAVKQLRYAVEFFSALFSARSMATLRDRLARLQDILGRINDAAVVDPLIRSATANDSEAAKAAGIVIGWCEAQAAREHKALQPAWRRFCRARKPWRE